MTTAPNQLFYGDNLDILREYIPTESVDLVYLDPPFNSSRNYNVLFKDESGKHSDAQIEAFLDTWHWDDSAERTYYDLIHNAPEKVSSTIGSLRIILGTNQMMAYLVMMTARLTQLHRVLKPTGSLYLHCDSTASHYLKIMLDTIFGVLNFKAEITWQRTSSHNDAKKNWAKVNDSILYYSKSDKYTFNPQYTPHTEEYIADFYKYTDEGGRRYRIDNLTSPNPRPNLVYEYKGYKSHKFGWRVSRAKMEQLDESGRLIFPKSVTGRIQLKRYLDEMPGNVMGTVWTDIRPIGSQARERLGYPTQKPVALLERIIAASSNPGDVILDPFCGCGTAIAAAHKLGRRWIGIDITHLAFALQKYRLKDAFDLEAGRDYQVIGEPKDVGAARQLANDDRYQFQWWALSLIKAKPLGGSEGSKTGKKGSDKGIDGVINFVAQPNGKMDRILVQVKSGKVKPGDIRDLVGVLDREQAAMGVFITLDSATNEMKKEAVSAGYYKSRQSVGNPLYSRVQICTIEDMLAGVMPDLPFTSAGVTFKRAEKVKVQENMPEQSDFLAEE